MLQCIASEQDTTQKKLAPCWFSSTGATPTTTSYDKMAADKRYTPANPVPEEVLKNMAADAVFSPGFSIKGHAKAGRASYLVSYYISIACISILLLCTHEKPT